MKTLKQHITEAKFSGVYDSLKTKDEREIWLDIYSKREKSVPIFRGMNAKGKMYFGHGDKLTRKSHGTLNYYTEFLDASPRWKEYPDRSKSFICSFSRKMAQNYGEVYYCLPLKNQIVGVCPEDDIWGSFSSSMNDSFTFTHLPDFNEAFEDVFRFVKMKLNIKSGVTQKENFFINLRRFQNYLNKFSLKHADHMSVDWRMYAVIKFFHQKNSKGINVVSALEELFDPQKNGFQKYNYVDIPIRFNKSDKECWMTDKVLFIHESLI